MSEKKDFFQKKGLDDYLHKPFTVDTLIQLLIKYWPCE